MIENPLGGHRSFALADVAALVAHAFHDNATRSEPVAAFILGRQVAFTLDK
jgi:hypothetical protein